MKILLQLGLVFGIYWASQCIEYILPFSFPASVIGLILLLVLLLVHVVKKRQIEEVSDFFLTNLSFFFVPAVVSVVNYVDAILENAVAFFTICLVSTVLTFGATAWTIRLVRTLMSKGKETEK